MRFNMLQLVAVATMKNRF